MSKPTTSQEHACAEDEEALTSATTFAALLFLAEKFPHRQFNAKELALLSGIGRTAITQIRNAPDTRAPAKRTATWVQVPPVQLDGSAPKTVPTASPRGGVGSRHGVEPTGRNKHMNHTNEPRKDTPGSRASEFLAKAAELEPRPTVEGFDNGPAGSAWATCQEVLCG